MTNLSGYPEQGRILRIDSLEVLKEGLSSDDSRVLMQCLATGDEYVKQGRVTAGEEVYRKVEKQARAAGRLDVAGAAMLRPAMVYVTLAKINAAYAGDARARIRRVTESRELAPYRVASRRYLPLALKGGTNGLVRVERFSYVFDVSTTTGSRMGVRNAAGRISSLDITAEPAEPQTDKGG